MERMKISIQEKRGRAGTPDRNHSPGRARGTWLRRAAGKLACFMGVGAIGILAVPVGVLVLAISGIWALTSRAASWGSREREQLPPGLGEQRAERGQREII